jgi:hypothetical protein
MYNFNYILPALIGMAIISGCRATRYTFDRDIIISPQLKDNIAAVVTRGPKDPVVETRIYKAEIRERLVNENSITEYSLRNTLSKKPYVNIEVERYHHKLFYYEFLTRDQLRYGLLMSTTFENGKCISIGPVYIGEVGIKHSPATRYLLVNGRLRLKKEKNALVPDLTRSIPEKKLRLFYCFTTEDESQLRFTQIVNELPNKISGLNKKLVYDIGEVFADPDALRFELIER